MRAVMCASYMRARHTRSGITLVTHASSQRLLPRHAADLSRRATAHDVHACTSGMRTQVQQWSRYRRVTEEQRGPSHLRLTVVDWRPWAPTTMVRWQSGEAYPASGTMVTCWRWLQLVTGRFGLHAG